MNKIPTEAECMELLSRYGTPNHIIGHCREVARVAVAIADRLNQVAGFSLDIDLIRAAGLTHDILRLEEEHWKAGAEALRREGYDPVAEIVETHMHYPTFSPAEETNETDLVCLGDRLVKFDRFVGVDERMDYIIDKAKKTYDPDKGDGLTLPQLIDRINGSREHIRSYVKDLEKLMKIDLPELLEEGK